MVNAIFMIKSAYASTMLRDHTGWLEQTGLRDHIGWPEHTAGAGTPLAKL
jgi:hypothetical protein